MFKIYFIRRKLFCGAVYESAKLPPLLGREKFEAIFKDFDGKKIGFVGLVGNVGDRLIEDSAVQLFKKFKIDFVKVNQKHFLNKIDEFAVNGGGNMGGIYPSSLHIRENLFKYGKPITILPQSFYNRREDLKYKKVFVRESESLKFREDGILAPDLALGYQYNGRLAKAKYDLGVWLRKDGEKTDVCSLRSDGDPIKICTTSKEYVQLAALYKKIVTDRLHFAIAGLIARREVVLLPNSYFKNYSMWKTWLKDLGCKWAESDEELLQRLS